MCACSLDLGTMFLVSARLEGDDEIKFVKQRNCFCTIDNEDGADGRGFAETDHLGAHGRAENVGGVVGPQ